MMDVLHAIQERRAVRDFSDEPVSEETVRELLDAAIEAPSAVNEQPWAFVIIQDKDELKRLSDAAKHLMPQEIRESRWLPTPVDEFNVFYNAGTLIVIYAKPIGLHPDWDCCFAGENLMLAARAKGLGTCVIGLSWPLFDDATVKQRLGVPMDCHVVLPIIVGRPRTFPATHGRNPAEILTWIKTPALV